jgi:hypothetical protein
VHSLASFALRVGLLGLLAFSTVAHADVLFFEPFNTDTASTAETLATYSPPFTYTGQPTDLRVVGGVLNMHSQGKPEFPRFTLSGYTGDITIEVDLGTTPGGAHYNTGLIIGDNRLLFHPNLSSGEFRVEGPGGYFNESMGFTPAPGILHHMTVAIDAETGMFNFIVTDANNPMNVYMRSITNPGYVPGGIIGMATDGFVDSTPSIVLFDNFTISRPTAVPESGSVALLSGVLVLTGLMLRRRK